MFINQEKLKELTETPSLTHILLRHMRASPELAHSTDEFVSREKSKIALMPQQQAERYLMTQYGVPATQANVILREQVYRNN